MERWLGSRSVVAIALVVGVAAAGFAVAPMVAQPESGCGCSSTEAGQ